MKLFKLKEDATPHPFRWWHIPLLVLLIGGTLYIMHEQRTGVEAANAASAWPDNEVQQTEGMTFGTIYHITYQSVKPLEQGIQQALSDVDLSLSPFNPESVITAINENRSDTTDSRFAAVFQLAKDIWQETYGAFDITVAPLVNAWGFGFKNAENISQERIDSIMQFVGFNKVDMTNGVIKKQDSRIMLDCSAIAKGFGVDEVGRYLESEGVVNYMVEIGGEVRVRGCNPKGKAWHIGITKPIDDSLSVNQELQEILELTDISLATSGNYRNFYEKDHKKYAHTIDPHTGYPVQHTILSSTVLASDCATADAYATAFMVMGIDSAKVVLEKHPELQAYFILSGNHGEMQTWHSEGLLLPNR